jgi:fructose-1,6-bisphosphatase I
MAKRISLTQYLVEQQREHGHIPAELRLLIEVVARACKHIAIAVNKGELGGMLGSADTANVQGEIQKKLDVISNEVLIEANEWGGHLAAMASEEMDTIHPVPNRYPQGEYLLLFDPLDGSSNIDVNVSIGTIFSIHERRTSPQSGGTVEDLLQVGTRQVAAGYVIYGSSTMLVYTTGQGVHGFTLDPSVGDFFLSHVDIRIPERGKIYSINEGNHATWHPGVQKWVEWLKTPSADKQRPYSARYVGSLVADFHRTLLKGGVFAYPADKKNAHGKLRLMYEAAPLALIAEQAGGSASTGSERILEIVPSELHQRVPLFIGSKGDVADALGYL